MIPLGILAVAGAGGAAAGAYELISTTLVTSDTATISFSSIVGSYKHLQIRATMRGGSSGGGGFTNTRPTVTLNGLGGTSYARHRLVGNGSTVTSSGDASQSQIYFGLIPGDAATTNSFGTFILDVLDYASTTNNKTVRALGGGTWNSNEVWLGSGLVQTTSAITSITIGSVNGGIGLGRFSLYGIAG